MSEQTIEKLKKMRLPIMAEEYQNQKDDPGYQNMTFEERLTLMVDREYDARINHTIERNIKNANFYDSNACLEDINYKPERKINKDLINELKTNDYIKKRIKYHFDRSVRHWKNVDFMRIWSKRVQTKIQSKIYPLT